MKLSFSWRRSICEGEEDDYSETNETLLEKENHYTTRRENRRSLLKLALAASIFFNLFLLSLGVTQYWSQDSNTDQFQQLYTPAEEVIEYRGQNFVNPNPKIDDGYSGPPTPERDAKWRALHYVGDTRLSKSEASRIHNKTAAAQPDTDEDYPIVLTVFHDLHCLDAIRLSNGYMRDPKWNSTYNPYTIPWPEDYESGLYSPGHAHHCFNSIRQSLQCFSDVTPQVFQYHPDENVIISDFNVLHTCRNFDAIHDWALGRRYTGVHNRTGWRDEQGICGPDGCLESTS